LVALSAADGPGVFVELFVSVKDALACPEEGVAVEVVGEH
jgi:hypothetical protein